MQACKYIVDSESCPDIYDEFDDFNKAVAYALHHVSDEAFIVREDVELNADGEVVQDFGGERVWSYDTDGELTESAQPAMDLDAAAKANQKMAAAYNKPVIYGYMGSDHHSDNKYFKIDPIVCDDLKTETAKVMAKYHPNGSILVAYPDQFNGEKLADLQEAFCFVEDPFDVDFPEVSEEDIHCANEMNGMIAPTDIMLELARELGIEDEVEIRPACNTACVNIPPEIGSIEPECVAVEAPIADVPVDENGFEAPAEKVCKCHACPTCGQEICECNKKINEDLQEDTGSVKEDFGAPTVKDVKENPLFAQFRDATIADIIELYKFDTRSKIFTVDDIAEWYDNAVDFMDVFGSELGNLAVRDIVAKDAVLSDALLAYYNKVFDDKLHGNNTMLYKANPEVAAQWLFEKDADFDEVYAEIKPYIQVPKKENLDTDKNKTIEHEENAITDIVDGEADITNERDEILNTAEIQTESCHKLRESFTGEDVIADLVDRAKGWVSDGCSNEEAAKRSIDDGLIYTDDRVALGVHYGVIDDNALVDKYYDELYQDIIKGLNKNSTATVEEDDISDEELAEELWKAHCDKKGSEELTEEKDPEQAPEQVNEWYHNYTEYDNWEQADIDLHKSIDWKARHWEDYDAGDEITAEVVKYAMTGQPERKTVKMHKFIRANAIYPPYYRAVESPFTDCVGPMYDGRTHGKYDIHDRYETQEVYDILSEGCTNEAKTEEQIVEAVDQVQPELQQEFNNFFFEIGE